jgi:nucleoside-specific outer membrane channel protein Tsx
MKKIMLAVALIVASAAPVMAEGFPNPTRPSSNRTRTRRTPMKKIMLAVALIVASAAPVMAEGPEPLPDPALVFDAGRE